MAKYLLSDSQLRQMTPGNYHDGGGLYCVIRSQTSASWHLRYTVRGRPDAKRKKMGFGPYPTVTLARARELADAARSMAAVGVDPAEERRVAVRRGVTVEQAINELFEVKRGTLKGNGNAGRWWSPVNNHILPAIGQVGVADLSTHIIVDKLGKVYTEQKATGDKVFRILRQMLEFVAADDPRVDTRILTNAKSRLGRKSSAKKSRDEGHQPALDWKMAPKLFASLPDDTVGTALAFYLLTLPRVSNVRFLTPDQIDLKEKVWIIPPEDMKTGVPFDAPLTRPALDLLRRAKRFEMKDSELIFPNPKGRKTPIYHINFLNNYLKTNCWKSTQEGRHATAHGLRATFRTWCAEHDIPRDLAEMSIQHETMNDVERSYQRSSLLKKRREILDRWADFVTSASRRQADQKRKLACVVNTDGQTLREVLKWSRDTDEPMHDDTNTTVAEAAKWARDD